jgi:hypothetical protein
MNNNLEPPFLIYDDSEIMHKKIDSMRLTMWRTIW